MLSRKTCSILLAIVILAVTFSACGQDNASTGSAPSAFGTAASGEFDLENLEPITMVFATMSLGSQYYTQTSAMNTVIMPYFPEGSQFDIQTTSAGGPAGFLLVGTGQADISITNPVSAKEGISTGLQDNPPMPHVRALVGGLENSCSFILFTESFVNRTGFTTLEEVVEAQYPVNLVSKALGSMGEVTCKYILEAHGVSYDDIKSWGGTVTHTDTTNVVDMLKDDRADICLESTNMTQANWMELTMTTNVHFAPMSESCLEYLYRLGYGPTTMPAGTYNGQVKGDYACTSSAGVLVVDESLRDEYAYLITKAMCENKDGLVAAFDGFQPFIPEAAGLSSKLGCELHPGARRYYEEVGYPTEG